MQKRKTHCIWNSITLVKIIVFGEKGLEMGLDSKTVLIVILSTLVCACAQKRVSEALSILPASS